MADRLVKLLNAEGYVPIKLPRTGVVPPELYNYDATARKLIRRGPLKAYLPAAGKIPLRSGHLASIESKQSGGQQGRQTN